MPFQDLTVGILSREMKLQKIENIIHFITLILLQVTIEIIYLCEKQNKQKIETCIYVMKPDHADYFCNKADKIRLTSKWRSF